MRATRLVLQDIPPGDSPEAIARQLKADGYTGGVVARKLISVHGVPQRRATEIVSALYGKKVDPNGGKTSTEVLIGGGMIAAGAILMFVIIRMMSQPIFGARGTVALIFSLGLIVRGFIRVMNAMTA